MHSIPLHTYVTCLYTCTHTRTRFVQLHLTSQQETIPRYQPQEGAIIHKSSPLLKEMYTMMLGVVYHCDFPILSHGSMGPWDGTSATNKVTVARMDMPEILKICQIVT